MTADAVEQARAVPVIVDALRSIDDTPMTRCLYYTIAAAEPEQAGLTMPNGIGVPFLLLGAGGVLYRPSEARERFESAEDIEAVYRLVEEHETLSVELEYLWFPARPLARVAPKGQPARGLVFRLRSDLFALAWRYRHGATDLTALLAGAEEAAGVEGAIAYSEAETLALGEFNRRQILDSRDNYVRQETLALAYDDARQDDRRER